MLRSSLISKIIDSISETKTKESSNEISREDLPKKIGNILTKQNSSPSLEISKFINSSSEKEKNENKTKIEKEISMDIIDYVSNTSDIMSSTLALLTPPKTLNDDNYLEYSLKNTKQDTALNNLAKSKLEMKKQFDQNFKNTQKSESEKLEIFSSLFSEEIDKETAFYRDLTKKLLEEGKLKEALELSDEYLSEGSSDYILKMLIQKTDKSKVHKYLHRLSNKKEALKMVLSYYMHWPLDICIELFYMCKCYADSNVEVFNDKYVLMNIYSNILEIENCPWKSWQELDEESKSNVSLVISRLIELKKFKLANRLATLFSQRDTLEIEEKSILYVLSDKNITTEGILSAIEELKDNAISVIENIIGKNVSNTTKLCLLQYLKNHPQYPKNKRESIIEKELAINMLIEIFSLMNSNEQKENFTEEGDERLYIGIQDLISYPVLILETLIMSERTFIVSKLIKKFPQLKDDNLFIGYAKKALLLDSPNSQPFLWILTGKEVHFFLFFFKYFLLFFFTG